MAKIGFSNMAFNANFLHGYLNPFVQDQGALCQLKVSSINSGNNRGRHVIDADPVGITGYSRLREYSG